jgi:nickel-dependent lactate racemase
MSLEEKVEVVHKVLIQHFKHEDVATLHQIKPRLIENLLKRVEKNKNFFQEL